MSDRHRVMLRRLAEKLRSLEKIQLDGRERGQEEWDELHRLDQLVNEAFDLLEGPPKWTTVGESDARLIYACPDCQTEYRVGIAEASIPYCTTDGCSNEECETDFDRLEVRR